MANSPRPLNGSQSNFLSIRQVARIENVRFKLLNYVGVSAWGQNVTFWLDPPTLNPMWRERHVRENCLYVHSRKMPRRA